MFAFFLRRKASTLIWQYLDGVIPPDRFELLQRMLGSNTWVRRHFVDCAVLNALLFAYFNPSRYSTVPSATGHPQPLEECEACKFDLDAELEAIEREEREREERELQEQLAREGGDRDRKTKRPAG